MSSARPHQYIDRESGQVRTERLLGDRFLTLAYAAPWENRAWLLRALSSPRLSKALSFFNYDLPFGARLSNAARFVRAMGLDGSECLDAPASLDSPRKVFERKIRYWEVRPMAQDRTAVVSPADARMLVVSFEETSSLFLKGKFFDYDELLGDRVSDWRKAFRGGDAAVFRLTPDKYHYNHTPVAGCVRDVYEIEGAYHSCNPGAIVSVATPLSKNKRVVTIIDTDVPGGTGVGLVAMIEVVALMIGLVEQRYSGSGYEHPRDVRPGMFLERGQPKSLYRPGSSTDVLLLQRGRVAFSEDLLRNQSRAGPWSRFSAGFGRPLVETEVKVRSTIGRAVSPPNGEAGR